MKIKALNRKIVAPLLPVVVVVSVLGGIVGAATQEIPQPGFEWKDGAEIYEKVCALCHETTTGPVLLGRTLDPLYIRLIVRNGSRAMPAFRAAEIDDESLKKLAEYVSKTAKGK
ncbi:MAG: cytochrome c [Nitrospirales bacterium]